MYADELAAAAGPGDHGGVPTFDVLMLGVGPDGHVASLFPGRPALYDERSVVGVRGSPKPPPLRITMTLPTLQRAHDVWFVVSGEDKARAVTWPSAAPASSRSRPPAPRHPDHLWLLDQGRLPAPPRPRPHAST